MIEDELRSVMSERESEAPRAEEFTPRVRRDKRVPSIAGSVLIVALVVVGIALIHRSPQSHRPAVTQQHRGPVAALHCPGHYQLPQQGGYGDVPAQPTGFDGGTRLVPAATPTSVVLCRYPGSYHPALVALSGRRVLHEGLGSVSDALRWVPPASPKFGIICLQNLVVPTPPTYLIGLTYPDGVVWVSMPNQCGGTTNGRFQSLVDPASSARRAFTTGAWPTSVRSYGRLGQQVQVVPGHPLALAISARVAIAHGGDDQHLRVRKVTSGFDQLVAALNSAHHAAWDGTCSHSPRPGARLYDLTFAYAEGPSVHVQDWQGCYPEVDNGNLQIHDGQQFFPLIEALLH